MENLVGYVRRDYFVPVPKVFSSEELNELLLKRCLEESNRRIGHREETRDRRSALGKGEGTPPPLAAMPFSCSRTVSWKVDSLSLVQELPGMREARVAFASGTLKVEYDSEKLSETEIRDLVRRFGVEVATVLPAARN